ncbi:MAG TPA: segregation/condensation protein A [Acidobacteriota bacterium]|nr:segregation/condensation protein A [Acidobacteriota bacterium]
MVAEADYRIKLPVFEGPLDLLLFLIRKNELDIYDIPIESVTKQYLEVLYAMKELELEVAGDFFVMAATLMEIKSRMLLPKHQQAIDPNADEEELDPRWELVHQLLQYKKFKEASGKLGEMARYTQDMLPRPASAFAPLAERPLKTVDRIELWNSFNVVLRRLAEKLVVGEIHAEQVTVADQMEYILERVKSQREFTFSSLFTTKIPLRTLVATFLAMLELTRLKKLTLRQDEAFADIYCTAVDETAPAPAAAIETPPADSPAIAVDATDANSISAEPITSDASATPVIPAPLESAPSSSLVAQSPSSAVVEDAPKPAPVIDQNALETPVQPNTVTPQHEESAPPPSH